MQGKSGVYFLADRRPEREQLREVAARLGGHFTDPFIGRKGLDTWLEAFEYLTTRLRPAAVASVLALAVAQSLRVSDHARAELSFGASLHSNSLGPVLTGARFSGGFGFGGFEPRNV